MTHDAELTNKLITIQKAAKHKICIKEPPAVVTATEGQHFNICYCQTRGGGMFLLFSGIVLSLLVLSTTTSGNETFQSKKLHKYCLILHVNSRAGLNELDTFEF